MKKLLETNFDCKLKSNKHIEDICPKASQKLNALGRLAPYVGTNKTYSYECVFQITI